MGLGRACDDEEPRGVSVEAVDNAGAIALVATGDAVPEQPVDEGPLAPAGTRMDDEARGLVDDQQMLVLVAAGDVHLLGHKHGRLGRAQGELEALSAT